MDTTILQKDTGQKILYFEFSKLKKDKQKFEIGVSTRKYKLRTVPYKFESINQIIY